MKHTKRKFMSKENIIKDIKCNEDHWGTGTGEFKHSRENHVYFWSKETQNIDCWHVYRIKDKAILHTYGFHS